MGTRTATEKRARRAEAIELLKKLCPRGAQVFTIQRGRNGEGSRWTFDAYVMHREGEDRLLPRRLNGLMRDAGLGRLDANGHLVVEGGGMDMSFSIVYDLSCLLYGRNEAGEWDSEGARSLTREAL